MEVKAKVAEAARILDEVNSGWYREINCDLLDMGIAFKFNYEREIQSCCILAQLYDHDYSDKIPLQLQKMRDDAEPPFGYETPKELWIEEVTKRL